MRGRPTARADVARASERGRDARGGAVAGAEGATGDASHTGRGPLGGASLVGALLMLSLGLVTSSRLTRADSSPPDPHAVLPERPTVATHAHTVAPGWVEIESGLERDRQGDGSRALVASLLTKVGLARRVQLNLNTPWARTESAVPSGSGPADFSAGLKWRLVDDAPVLGDFAILPSLKLPTGAASRGTGTGTTDASLLLISSNDIGALSLDVNVGYTRRSGNGQVAPKEATLWTASAGFPLVGLLGGVTEVYGLPGTAGPQGGRPVVAVLLGPTAEPRPWLELDAGLIVPVTGPQPHALYGGFVWSLGRL